MNNDLNIKAVHMDHEGKKQSDVKRFGRKTAAKVRPFHESFPEYTVTPLAKLSCLAKKLGLAELYVKDESPRFGLNAFKVLGGSYAIGSYIAKRLGMDISRLSCEKMASREIKDRLGDITFVTATDGNHGRGVAWTAERLGQKAVVYMPEGTRAERLENIKALGADASIVSMNYDDTVRKARDDAKKYGWVLVQDTAWDGYEEVPEWIMQGYTTIAEEAVGQLKGEKPTHIFLQAGVGSMAGALAGYFSDLYGDTERPIITIVEPNQADCFYRTAAANDGKMHFVKGDMNSIMAGLCCGEPCPIAWEILRDYADNFVSVPDCITEKGMRLLARPAGGDQKVISGESGAVTTGLVAEVMSNSNLDWLRKMLKLDENSRVLCFSTEGDTDKENYRRIMEKGVDDSLCALIER